MLGRQQRPAATAVLIGAPLSAAAAVYVLAPSNAVSLAVILVAVIGSVAVLLVPVRWLPALAVALFVAVPQQLLAGGVVAGASPAAIVLAVWVARRRLAPAGAAATGRADTWVRLAQLCGIGLLAWGVVVLASSPWLDLGSSVSWLVSFALGAVAVLFVRDGRDEVGVLLRAWPILTAVSAAYVVVELLIGANPVFDPLYQAVGRPIVQEWSTYRPHGSFGHPLYAATFFATSFGLAFANALASGRGSRLWAATSLVGLVATVSRGALLAAVISAAVVLLLAPMRVGFARLPSYRVAMVLAVACVVAVGASGVVQGRAGTVEAASSSAARWEQVPRSVEVARSTGWRGAGPGVADLTTSYVSGQTYPVENSFLQILISLGLAGLVAFTGLLGALLAYAIKGGNIAAVGGLVAFVVAIASYNAIETLLPLHALLGVLFVVTTMTDGWPVVSGVDAGTRGLPVPADAR